MHGTQNHFPRLETFSALKWVFVTVFVLLLERTKTAYTMGVQFENICAPRKGLETQVGGGGGGGGLDIEVTYLLVLPFTL